MHVVQVQRFYEEGPEQARPVRGCRWGRRAGSWSSQVVYSIGYVTKLHVAVAVFIACCGGRTDPIAWLCRPTPHVPLPRRQKQTN
jgi:hypothetical protein